MEIVGYRVYIRNFVVSPNGYLAGKCKAGKNCVVSRKLLTFFFPLRKTIR